jgi:hypothetical protein
MLPLEYPGADTHPSSLKHLSGSTTGGSIADVGARRGWTEWRRGMDTGGSPMRTMCRVTIVACAVVQTSPSERGYACPMCFPSVQNFNAAMHNL